VTLTDDALRQAARRLLDGTSLRTDGALTVQNLAREAGVARATAYRSPVLGEFRDAIAYHDARQPGIAPLRHQIRELNAELAEARRCHAQEAGELRADRNQLLQLVQLLTLERDNLLRHPHPPNPIATLARRSNTARRDSPAR
jgi:hypothetical protein